MRIIRRPFGNNSYTPRVLVTTDREVATLTVEASKTFDTFYSLSSYFFFFFIRISLLLILTELIIVYRWLSRIVGCSLFFTITIYCILCTGEEERMG